MRILLLSPYDAMSHRYWREGLVAAFPDFDFSVVTLPDRYFSWRLRGNSLTLAHDERLGGEFDLILATSMTDLSALIGMQPSLVGIPSVVYFHENQFAYPSSQASAGDVHRVDRQITSLYTAVAASRVIFNSDFNRRTFLDGAWKLLRAMPDHVPAGVVDAIGHKSYVLSVPLGSESFMATPKPQDALHIVWNHRWEYDKGPDDLYEIVARIGDAGLDFQFHLLGQQFRRAPKAFDKVTALLRESGRLGSVGFLPRREYLETLAKSHVVLSTALHEFQGLAVLEGAAAGATPVVPDRLVYPELLDSCYRYTDVDQAVDKIDAAYQRFKGGDPPLVPDVSALAWPNQRSAWRAMLEFGR